MSKTVTVAMISPAYVVTLAAYNRWQNENLFDAAQTLADVERRRDRGAFFGSIHGTLNHILWADEFWMGRLVGRPHPKTPIASSSERFEDWDRLCEARTALDAEMQAWAAGLDPTWLAAAAGKRTNGFIVMHLFNHSTHHRGQVHAMLTAAGASPGDTDLLKLPIAPPDA